MKKMTAMFLALVLAFSLCACSGSKDAVAGTWSADLGDDGVITWTFDGKGKCSMESIFLKQDGTYSIDGDQMTVKLELWDSETVYTFSVDGSSLTMTDNAGYAVGGTFTKS